MLLHEQCGIRPDWMHTFVTLRCNMRCSFCSVATDDKVSDDFGGGFTELDGREWQQIFHKADRNILFGGGEPFIHPGMMDILWAIQPRKRVQLFTNGMLLKPSIIRSLGEWAERSNAAGGRHAVELSYHPPADVDKFIDVVHKVRAAGVAGTQMAVREKTEAGNRKLQQVKQRLQERGISFNIRADAYDRLVRVTPLDPPGTVYCRRQHTVVAPDGRRYPCVRHMLTHTSPMENMLSEDIGRWEQIYTCQEYGKCTVCDLDRFCKIATTAKEVQGPVERQDFSEV